MADTASDKSGRKCWLVLFFISLGAALIIVASTTVKRRLNTSTLNTLNNQSESAEVFKVGVRQSQARRRRPWSAPARSDATGGVHDDRDTHEADHRADDVVAIGTKPVEHHSPGQRPGHEHTPVGGQDAAEVGVDLQRRYEAVKAERDHTGAHPHQATVFAHSLPHEPSAADLSDRG